MRMLLSAAAMAAAVLVAGCNTMAPVQNVTNAPVTNAANRPLKTDEVRAAILRAGSGLGWVMKDAGPGRLTGTLALREHTAEVDIPYSSSSYSITYRNSTNLNAANGNIHRNYNGWVQNLTRAINAQLSAA